TFGEFHLTLVRCADRIVVAVAVGGCGRRVGHVVLAPDDDRLVDGFLFPVLGTVASTDVRSIHIPPVGSTCPPPGFFLAGCRAGGVLSMVASLPRSGTRIITVAMAQTTLPGWAWEGHPGPFSRYFSLPR